jgi:acetyl-CoA decarbonylase/synthase complex subunit gamma
MALSGLDIYKLLPKTNCKECGFATCLAFAMALAQKKVSLDKCPHVTASAKEALESASQPPMKLVTVGTGDAKLEIGNETVMHRHEQKFHHPTGIGILIEDTLSDGDIDSRVAAANSLKFERVGLTLKPDLICVKGSSGDKTRFLGAVNRVSAATALNLALFSKDTAAMAEAAAAVMDKRPLLIAGAGTDVTAFAKIAKENKAPLAVTAKDLEEAARLTEAAKAAGVEEVVINIGSEKMSRRIQDLTYSRRMALRKNFRLLGYPTLVFTGAAGPGLELAEAVSYVLKYAGIVIVNDTAKEFVFPLLVARQDIYNDPQKPVQVEPKIYEVGRVSQASPVLVTTNFSITYFTVAGEVEASKVPSYIVCCDSEGMSVLTAWAAEKFTAEKISDTLKKCGIENTVAHKNVVIPGYVSVLSGKLTEISGWKVSVGPKEASGIPNFLRSYK